MKTILYGAFGRYNFGDLLFPHVVTKLLNYNKIDTELEYCDILSRNMSRHGGHNVKSILSFFKTSDPINVIHVGGAMASDYSFENILKSFEVKARHKKEIDILKDFEDFKIPSAYMLSKKSFINPKIFVANCVGSTIGARGLNFIGKHTASKIQDYDFLSFRERETCNFFKTHGLDKSICCVDSAIMTKRFFNPAIQKRSKRLMNTHGYGNNYIAVQFNFRYFLKHKMQIESALNEIIRKYNLPIVFFAAGTSPGHDNINSYQILSEKLPKGMSFVSKTKNIWNACSIIANSNLVLNTSLHVRILAMQYFKPRLTFITDDQKKQVSFINQYDNLNNDHVSLSNICELIKNVNDHDNESDARQLEFLENEYLTKSTWINLLK